MRNLLLILLAIAICSCGRKSISKNDVIDLPDSPSAQISNLSDIADDVEYIPFQTSEESLIRYISEMRITDKNIYIYTPPQILCFDNKGNYKYKLNKPGNGPEEYASIYDWDISPENNQLFILTRGKLMIYNETVNGFVYSKNLNLTAQPSNVDLCPDQKSILFSFGSTYGNEPFRFVLLNMNGDTLKVIPNHYNYVKNTKMMFISKAENIHFSFDNSLYFKYWLSDTVFALDRSNDIKPALIFNSHGKQTTPEALAAFSEATFSDFLNVSSIMETSRYLLYRYSWEKSTGSRILDKKTRELKGTTISSGSKTKWFTDDITGGVDFEPKFCIGGNLYSWVEALTFKSYISSDAFKNSTVIFPDKKAALEKLAGSLNETDNPVLVIVTPKE